MTRLPLALSTFSLLALGCLDNNSHAPVSDEASKPVVKRPELPAIAAPIMQADGTLAEKLTQVKLPAAKSGEATTFRFGKENERKAWVATLPERGQLVSVAYEKGKIFVGGGFDS